VLELFAFSRQRINKSGFIFIFIILMTFTQQAFSSGKIITDTIVSKSLQGNKLGDSNTRNMTIYLPPGYESSSKIYPVIYLLHGFGGDERSFVGEVTEPLAILIIDSAIESGLLKETIIVMPNAKTKYGGSYYLNSELTGNYEDYIAKELVGFIDNKYRTIQDRSGRAIAGASMGGYGSMTLGMKHPDSFVAIASLSPPLSFDMIAKAMVPEVIKENPNGMPGPGPNAKQFTAYIYALSAALSPNLNNPPFFVDLPFEYPSGKIIEDVRLRWLKADPLAMIPAHIQALMRMKGIYIDVGDQDLPGFNEAAKIFSQELTKTGIKHKFNIYIGGHADRAVERAINSLTFLSALLTDPAFPSAITTYKGKLTITWGMMKKI
jgi:S-formylglutathione hydrolase